MKLKIVDEDSPMLHTALGISEERSNNIADSMDDMMKIFFKSDKPVKLCDIMQCIAALCLTTEELVYAIHTNTKWIYANTNQPMFTK